MITNFEQLSAMTALLTDDELQALADKCRNLVADRERIKRNELRIELMENLQKALSDIIHGGFTLSITNTDRDEEDECNYVFFEPGDIYSIDVM